MNKAIMIEVEESDMKEVDGQQVLELKHPMEKLFWDMSADQLNAFIFNMASEKAPSLVAMRLAAEKVQSQREFMKSNKALRDALLP